MANQRGTFSKRNREMKLKDRAKEKAERRAIRGNQPSDTKGPQIAWDQPGGVESVSEDPAPSTESGTDTDNDIPDGPTRPADSTD
jgi:hypothetical protein